MCCAFLSFELTETGEEVRLTITVPERRGEVADALFEQFVPFWCVPGQALKDGLAATGREGIISGCGSCRPLWCWSCSPF